MPTENKPASPFGPNGRTFHIHLSVRGAIRDFSKRQLKACSALMAGNARPTRRKIICSKRWPWAKRCFLSGRRAMASTSLARAVPDTTTRRRL